MFDVGLKQQFREVAENEYELPEGVDALSFMLDALPLLGDPDGPFREQYVYGAFHRWIVGRVLDDDALRTLHDALLSENVLFSGLGESETDSVFLRAFSALLLAPLLYAHREQSFLSVEQVRACKTALIHLLREERDLRGYISQEKWWAHVIAHSADAIGQLVRCPEFSNDDVDDLLGAVAKAMTTDQTVFVFEEDARMTAAVVHLLGRDLLDEKGLSEWLTSVVPEHRWTGELPFVHHRYLNARNFLRCLLFQSAEAKLPKWVLDAVQKAHDALPKR